MPLEKTDAVSGNDAAGSAAAGSGPTGPKAGHPQKAGTQPSIVASVFLWIDLKVLLSVPLFAQTCPLPHQET